MRAVGEFMAANPLATVWAVLALNGFLAMLALGLVKLWARCVKFCTRGKR